MAQLVKNLPAIQETSVRCLAWEDHLKKGKAPPLQYSSLEKSMDQDHGVAKSWSWLSNFHFTSSEKEQPGFSDFFLCKTYGSRILVSSEGYPCLGGFPDIVWQRSTWILNISRVTSLWAPVRQALSLIYLRGPPRPHPGHTHSTSSSYASWLYWGWFPWFCHRKLLRWKN